MKICPRCGSKNIQYKSGWWKLDNPPTDNFCYDCGYFFTKEETNKMNEYLSFTLRMIQDDPSFFYWIREDHRETLKEYVLHLQMNEAQRLYGGN